MENIIIATDKDSIKNIVKEAIEDSLPNLIKEFNKSSTSKDQYVSRAEYAKRNGISIQLVDKLRRQGKLQYKKVGRRMLIKVDNA
jgi:hypothetical protein